MYSHQRLGRTRFRASVAWLWLFFWVAGRNASPRLEIRARTHGAKTAPHRHASQERHRMADDRIPMTREGYEKKKAELDRMQHYEMIEVTKRIATARELGDLSENAEYHAAREDQGM